MRKQKTIIQAAVLATVILLAHFLRAQVSDEDKKRLFLQSREDIQPVTKPSPSAAEHPRPKPRSTRRPTPDDEPTSKPRPKPTPQGTPKEEETPRHKPRSTPHEPSNNEVKQKPKKPAEEKPSPAHEPKPSESPDFITLPGEIAKPTPQEKQKPSPPPRSPSPAPTPAQTPSGKSAPSSPPLDAPILIEKSGLQEHQGYEPPSRPLFNGFFKRWRYLTPSTRKAIDQAVVERERWKYIIVHNSGTRQGNARIFDVYHRNVRKMQNGLAYHFVIGNGNSSGDGEIEIGNRWTRQINGGHVASDYLNNIALGICLVGDFNRDRPTTAQFAALDELITYLRIRVGKIKGNPSIVKGHKEINPKPTDCPGDRFDLRWLHQKFP